ncbi:MAG: ribose 5-phosphate isomerase B [Candidatus Nanoarchaeia archaeon]
MKILFGCDHAGFEKKHFVFEALESLHCEYEDMGVYTKEKGDMYPRIAKDVCTRYLKDDSMDFAILMCGSGTGMAIAANRINGIRAVLCYDEYSAKMARLDNNANVLCLRAREFDNNLYYQIIKNFLETNFSEEERHKKRVEQLDIVNHEEFDEFK